jgi:hypothetical protein
VKKIERDEAEVQAKAQRWRQAVAEEQAQLEEERIVLDKEREDIAKEKRSAIAELAAERRRLQKTQEKVREAVESAAHSETASREAKMSLSRDRKSVEAQAASVRQQQEELGTATAQLVAQQSDFEASEKELRRGQQQLVLERREFERQMASRDAAAEMNAEQVVRLEKQLAELQVAMAVRAEVGRTSSSAGTVAVAQQRESQVLDHLLTHHEQEDDMKTANMRSRAATTLDVLVGAVGALTPPRIGGKISDSIGNDDDDDYVLHGSDDEAALLAEVLNTPERVQSRQDRGRRSIPGVRGAAPPRAHVSSSNRETHAHVLGASHVREEPARLSTRTAPSVPADAEMAAPPTSTSTLMSVGVHQGHVGAYQAAERLSKHQAASAPSSACSSIESSTELEWQRRSADAIVRSPQTHPL